MPPQIAGLPCFSSELFFCVDAGLKIKKNGISYVVVKECNSEICLDFAIYSKYF